MMKISAWMMCLALAACASSHNKDNASASTDGAINPNDSSMTSTAQSWDGVVLSIDRLDSGMAAGGATGAMAGSAAMGGYRVTVRKDDGATDTVVVSNLPAYRTGDKVTYRNGTLSPSNSGRDSY
jgi:outer membrane lipoprotein SlyB